MTGMAAGMALCGLRPITYTITSFNTFRCIEQIKIDICYHNLPVIIVGVGSGLSYAELGATHHSLEDIAMLRVLPNITIICPGDVIEVRLALRAALRHEGPAYIRLGKKNEPVVHHTEPSFEIGKGMTICEGEDICILSTGNILSIALGAATELQEKGVSAQVVNMHTVKPLDTDILVKIFDTFSVVAALEEHSIIGGFSSSVAEWIADQPPLRGRLLRIGINDEFIHGCGRQEKARRALGLTSKEITIKVLNLLQNGTSESSAT
jgi:transketolase